jgi:hypothetical protein
MKKKKKKEIRKVKAFIFLHNKDEEDKVDVIMEDGGYANSYARYGGIKDEYSLLTVYFGGRFKKGLTKENFSDQMDEMDEAGFYDWDGSEKSHPFKENADDEVIDNMIDWLYMATDEYEIEKIVFKSYITDEVLDIVIPQLKLEDEEEEEA